MENLPKEESTPKIRPWSIPLDCCRKICLSESGDVTPKGLIQNRWFWCDLYGKCLYLYFRVLVSWRRVVSFTQMGAHVLLIGAKTAKRSDGFWLGSEWTRGNDPFWKSLNLCHKVILPKMFRCLCTIHIITWCCVWSRVEVNEDLHAVSMNLLSYKVHSEDCLLCAKEINHPWFIWKK